MRAIIPAVLLASMTLAACQQGRTNGNETAAAAQAAPVAKPAAAAPATATPPADCAPQPKLALAADFADPRKAFVPDAPAFRQTAANFRAAYRKACATGVLRGHPLIEVGATQPDTLFLKNAPDANDAAIYRDGGGDAPTAQRVMVLEYVYLSADGNVHVPKAADISEAIFCAVQGATAKEEQENGRCLVD